MSKPDTALAGATIWVTRPAAQAEPLCAMVLARGGKAVKLPTLVIKPAPPDLSAARAVRLLAQAELVIFISRNAVVEAHRLLSSQLPDALQSKTVLAVGQATAAALAQLGTACIQAGPGGDATEALLRLPALAAARIKGKRALLARGTGGRETLRERLQARGAMLDYLEVYQRIRPDISQADMTKFWHDQPPDAIVVTSLAGLDNLVALTPAESRAQLRQTALVVMSERIRQHAGGAGFDCVAVATDNSDDGLMQALLGLHEGTCSDG